MDPMENLYIISSGWIIGNPLSDYSNPLSSIIPQLIINHHSSVSSTKIPFQWCFNPYFNDASTPFSMMDKSPWKASTNQGFWRPRRQVASLRCVSPPSARWPWRAGSAAPTGPQAAKRRWRGRKRHRVLVQRNGGEVVKHHGICWDIKEI